MSPENYNICRYHMVDHNTHGAKSFRKKQFKRLVCLLDEIFEHEPISNFSQMGKRQIIGYWRRHEHESQKTRIEKWRVLKELWNQLGKDEPPKPKTIQKLN